jgi:hypothetical protein
MAIEGGFFAGGLAESLQKGFILQAQQESQQAQMRLRQRAAIFETLRMAREDIKDKTPDQQKLLMNAWFGSLEQQMGRPLAPSLKKFLTSDPAQGLDILATGVLSLPGVTDRFHDIISSEEIFASLFSPMLSAYNQQRNMQSVFGAQGPMAKAVEERVSQAAPPGAGVETFPVDLALPQGRPLEAPTALPEARSPFDRRKLALIRQMDTIQRLAGEGRLDPGTTSKLLQTVAQQLDVLNKQIPMEDQMLGLRIGVDPSTPEGQRRIKATRDADEIEKALRDRVFSLARSAEEADIKVEADVRETIFDRYGVVPGGREREFRGPGISLQIGGDEETRRGRGPAPAAPKGLRPETRMQMESRQKLYTKLRDEGEAARTALPELQALSRLNPVSGELRGPARAKLDAFVQVFGINPRNKNEAELFESIANRLVFAEMGGKLGVGFSNADREFTKTFFPSIKTSPQARQTLITFLHDVLNRRQQIARMADRWVEKYRTLDSRFFDKLERWSELPENQLHLKYAALDLSNGR